MIVIISKIKRKKEKPIKDFILDKIIKAYIDNIDNFITTKFLLRSVNTMF